MLRPDQHYDEGQLTAAADGELDTVYGAGSEALLGDHLAQCPRCRDALIEVKGLRDFVNRCLAFPKC